MKKILFFVLLFTVSSYCAQYNGDLPNARTLVMTVRDAAYFYGIVGLACGYIFWDQVTK